MQLHQLHPADALQISPKARELLDFDMDSIRQVISAEHQTPPTIWLVDPDQYELNGRLLRDSTSTRLLAYSPERTTLYVTDGCNSCAHHLDFGKDDLHAFAEHSEIHVDFLERMAQIIAQIIREGE